MIDQTHRFVANVAYELPFFKGKKGAVGLILGGWETGGILSLFSGPPLGIVEATSTTDAQGGGQRANWTGVSAKLSNPTVQKWFDTSQFTLAAPYAFGNVAHTLSGLHGDSLRGLDFTLKKSFPIKERLHLQFRAEVFNITNTPQFAVPGTTLGAAWLRLSHGAEQSAAGRPICAETPLLIKEADYRGARRSRKLG